MSESQKVVIRVRKLAAWAEQEIRELDELCRSQIPDYDSLGSQEMGHLKELKAIAAGESGEIEDPTVVLKRLLSMTAEAMRLIQGHRTIEAMESLEVMVHFLGKKISRKVVISEEDAEAMMGGEKGTQGSLRERVGLGRPL